MPTLKSETVDDINNALSRLWRLPRPKRVAYLSRAKTKLMVRVRHGEPVNDLYLKVQRVLAKEKRRLDKTKKEAPPPESERAYEVVDKRLRELNAGEAMYPQSERYHGMLTVRDEDGYYVTNGEDRTDSYGYYGHIPTEEIEALVDEDNPDS